MACPTQGFSWWVLCGPKIEAERQRLYDLIYPEPIKEPGRSTIYPKPDYGDHDRNRFALSIVDRGIACSWQGFDMDQYAPILIGSVDSCDPDELDVVNSVLAELDETYQSQDLTAA